MSAILKSAAPKLDWAKIIQTLGLTGQTAALLTAFKKRHDEAAKSVLELLNQLTEVDFAHYKLVLKNQDIVAKVEAAFKDFKPVTYDVSQQLKTLQEFEATAVKNAEATELVVGDELKELQATLARIQEARPFSELTVDEVAKVYPQIDEKVSHMVKNGQWTVKGYREKFGDLNVM